MRCWLIALLPLFAGQGPERLFSRHVQVLEPRGEFVERLIRLEPPDRSWRRMSGPRGWSVAVPPGARRIEGADPSRTLALLLEETAAKPRPVLRIDVYPAEKGHPEAVDPEYAREYAEQYPEHGFGGGFSVTDSGHVTLAARWKFAMVGGSYPQGGTRGHRMQWAHLSRESQTYITFDCPETDWPRFSDLIGRALLSLSPPGRNAGAVR